MAILFAASELEAFKISSTTDVTGVTTAAELDGAVARAAIRTQQQATVTVDFTAQTSGWLHFKFYAQDPNSSSTQGLVTLIDTATGDAGVFRLRTGANSGGAQMLLNSTPTWTAPVGSLNDLIEHVAGNVDTRTQWINSGVMSEDGLITFDFNWNMAASGHYEWFINGISVVRFDGDTTPVSNTQIDQVTFTTGEANAEGITYSEIIIADEDTRGMKVVTLPPEAAGGTNTAWTGAYTDVDETALNDTDVLSSNTTGQIEQIGFSAFSMPSNGWDVMAVVVGFRGKDDASGVQQVRASIRSGTTDYNGTTQPMTTSFDGYYHVWTQDPDTGPADWTIAGVDALEYGVESIT